MRERRGLRLLGEKRTSCVIDILRKFARVLVKLFRSRKQRRYSNCFCNIYFETLRVVWFPQYKQYIHNIKNEK